MRIFQNAATTAGALCIGLLPGIAGAHPNIPLDPTLPTDASYAATDNIEYLGRFPEHSGTAGGRLLGDRFYLTDPRGVYIYDVSTPSNPTLLGSLLMPQGSTGVALAQEDPDTDGKILLVDSVEPSDPTLGTDLVFGTLRVIDVSDPANLRQIGTADAADHTWNCVAAEVDGEMNGCAYAYGRSGWIIDLRDPTDPVVLDNSWRAAVGYGDFGNSPYTHDLTQIKPGLVMSAGSTNILMDTTDPANPVELTRVEFNPPRFSSLGYHQVEWPNGGQDPIAIFGTEIAPSGATNDAGSDCEASRDGGENSVIETWDASAVTAALSAYEAGGMTAEEFRQIKFELLDAFDAGARGIFLSGASPAHVLYCAHWFEAHPDFNGAGKLAVSYYQHGTRFVEVDEAGQMNEIGWITPVDGYSGSAQWISDDIVYIMDYRRGMEVVRLTDNKATGVVEKQSPPPPVASRSGGIGGLGIPLVTIGLLLLILIRRRS